MDAGIYKSLMKKAVGFLSRRAYSRTELYRKLEAFAESEHVENVITVLERLNLLNDSDYAYNFALRRIGLLGWSQARVRNLLLGHEVDAAVIEEALKRAYLESGGEESVLRRYAQKRFEKAGLPSSRKEVRKLIMHLRHRGFVDENIFRVLRENIPEEILPPFETGEYID
jgi:regulatory protein